MGTRTAIGLALTTFLTAASPVEAVDLIYGEYDGHCRADVTYWIAIKVVKPGKTYRVQWSMSVQGEADKVLCRLTGVATLRKGNTLVGTFDNGSPFDILKQRNSDIRVDKVAGQACGRPMKINGAYTMVGD